MGKIHKALEKSQRNKAKARPESSQPHLTPVHETGRPAENGSHSAASIPGDDHFDKDLVAYFNPESFEAEQFRKLAAKIVYQGDEDPGRCFLITSATQGEGKSFLTANLAVSLAKSLEEPVLLMDCDLRKPRLHKLFGISDAPGLSDHFIKEMALSALIQETAVDHLSILPAGSESFHAAELLSSKRMSQILESVKSLHKDRIILIDSPPPLSTTEPIAIARRVDAVILVAKYGATPKAMVEDLIKTIGKEKILGIVLNRFDRQSKKYYRYHTY